MPTSCGWDEALERRLRGSRTEATREVLALAKEMYIGDAIALVIETLPASKTLQLRRWNDDWEAWCEWLKWEDRGWEFRWVSSSIVGLLAPEMTPYRTSLARQGDPSERPHDEAIAAAIDVAKVKFLGVSRCSTRECQVQFLYKVY